MKSTLPNFKRSQRILAALVASGAVFATGCANMASTATGTGLLGQAATVGGSIHGGNQPVAFATVNLWYAGQGSTAASIGATTTSANNGSGSFSFVKDPTNGDTTTGNTYSCPSSDPLVYLVATGGNTINSGDNAVNNAASVFLAPLGDCNSISGSTFVDMTEVTTVATMAALQQYFNPSSTSTLSATAESFAFSGTGLAKTAITNAFATIPNLVNLANGKAITSLAIPAGSITAGVGYTGTSVTATPETAKINTIANILASCINNASATAANCTTLFNNAVPPDPTTTSRPTGTSFSNAADVLQAVYYMLTNPTDSNSTNLTNLFGLVSAAGAPFQPSLSSAPTDWTIAISYSSASTCGANTGHLINSAQGLAIDTFGGVWIANKEPGVGNLSQISANGVPVTCIAVGTGANTGITIDSLGGTGAISDIWLADSGASNVYRYLPGTSTSLAFPTAAPPMAIAADGTGNVYFTSPSNAVLYEIPQGVPAVSAVSPVSVATSIGSAPATVFVDSFEAVWTTSGSNFITRTASSTPNTGLGFTSTSGTQPTPTYGLSVTAVPSGGSQNYVFIDADGSSNSVSLLQGSGTSYTSVGGWPATGLSTPVGVASDGAQNVWAINNLAGANSIVEIGLAKQALSPAGGFVKSSTYLGGGRSLVIDQAGNVWVGLDGANSITEIVGAAVPVYQPYAGAISAGRFQTIP